jgi:hypothetical protein
VPNGWICVLFIYGLLETLTAAKAGTVFAVIRISLPVAGLRPARALRLRGRKVPKPTTVTRLPLATFLHDRVEHRVHRLPCRRLADIAAFAATWTRSCLVTTCGMRSPSIAYCTIHCARFAASERA